MAAPTFVNSYKTTYANTTASGSLSLTTQAGDLVVVYAASENNNITINTPSGNGITFTRSAFFDPGGTNYAPDYIWTGTDTTGGTGWTLSLSASGTSVNWGATAIVFRNAAVGTAITATKNDGTYTTTITTTQANSAIVTLLNDWSANADPGNNRVWATVNGYTPSSGNGEELNYEYVNGAYTVFGGYYPDAGAVGSKTVGLSTGPGTLPHISFAVLEVTSVTTPGLIGWMSFSNSMDPPLTTSSNFYGRYDFSGGDWTDNSGNGNTITLTSGGYTAAPDRKGVANNAYTLDGSTGYGFTSTSFVSPQVYSANVWFKTGSSAGGVLAGFADGQFTSMSNYDRLLYMDASGRLNFGVYDGTTGYVITSAGSYNNNSWHMATMVMSASSGMTLYVDGTSVGTNANTVSQNYTGWWHIGYCKTAGWTNSSGSDYFPGAIDDIWIYKIALTSTQITQLYNI